jgi:hypothetical protein
MIPRPNDTWLVLTSRYGADSRDPLEPALANAVNDLQKNKDDTEHPNAWLRYGLSDGRVFVLEAYTSGTVYLQEFKDQDDSDPTESHEQNGVAPEDMLRHFQLLASGDLDGLKKERWN